MKSILYQIQSPEITKGMSDPIDPCSTVRYAAGTVTLDAVSGELRA